MIALSAALLALLVVTLLVATVTVALRLQFEQPRNRDVVRVRHALGPAILVATVVGVGLTLLGATTVGLTYSVDIAGPDSDATLVGETVSRVVEVPVATLPGTTYVVRGRGVAVDTWEREGSALIVTVALPVADEGGTSRATLRLTPYPATLPRSTVASLHDLSPVAAMAGSTGSILVPLYLLGRVLLDGDRPLIRTRRRWLRRRLGE